MRFTGCIVAVFLSVMSLSCVAAATTTSRFVKYVYLSDEVMTFEDEIVGVRSVKSVFSRNSPIIFYTIGLFDKDVRPNVPVLFKLECLDEQGETVYLKIKSILPEAYSPYAIYGLVLSPKLHQLAPDQLLPLKEGHRYFVRLYINRKLISITPFLFEKAG